MLADLYSLLGHLYNVQLVIAGKMNPQSEGKHCPLFSQNLQTVRKNVKIARFSTTDGANILLHYAFATYLQVWWHFFLQAGSATLV